jgi:peroxiredoxin
MNNFRFVARIVIFLLIAGTAAAADMKAAPKAPAEAPKAPAMAAPAPPAAPVAVKVGGTAQNFQLKDVDAKDVDLTGLKAKSPYTALVFTNSVCSACRDEMAMLAKFGQKNKEKIQLVAIFTDASTDVGAKATREMYKDSFVYVMDPEFAVPPAFGFEFTPAMVLLDKSGKVLYMKGGYNRGMAEQTAGEIAAYLK